MNKIFFELNLTCFLNGPHQSMLFSNLQPFTIEATRVNEDFHVLFVTYYTCAERKLMLFIHPALFLSRTENLQ